MPERELGSHPQSSGRPNVGHNLHLIEYQLYKSLPVPYSYSIRPYRQCCGAAPPPPPTRRGYCYKSKKFPTKFKIIYESVATDLTEPAVLLVLLLQLVVVVVGRQGLTRDQQRAVGAKKEVRANNRL